jgi:hypothetical protein
VTSSCCQSVSSIFSCRLSRDDNDCAMGLFCSSFLFLRALDDKLFYSSTCQFSGNNLLAPAHKNWLPIGIIGIVLGIILVSAGAYAENYRQLGGASHDDYGMPLIQVLIRPYASLVFPFVVFGLCALVVGIAGVPLTTHRHMRER